MIGVLRARGARLFLATALALAAASCSGNPASSVATAPAFDPQGAVRAGGTPGEARTMASPSAPAASDPSASVAPLASQAANGDLVALVRDARLAHAPRPSALLVTELQALEQLLAATATSSPDRPTIARRLAEDYSELRRAASAEGKRELANKASSKAIEYLELLGAQYPKYPRLDEVLYEAGLEREQSGDLAGARKSYLELFLKVPTSPLVPPTYARFGELFLAEAASDPQKLRLAQQAYDKVLGYPPPDNRAYGLAHLRLAEIAAKTGDDPRALKELKSAIEFGMQYPELPGAAELTRVARKELVASYARVGAADAVYPFFKAMMGDGALDAMMDLADGYVTRGQAKDAFLVLSDVLRRDQGHSCERAPRVQRTSDAAKDHSGVGQLELERLAKITTAMCAGK